MKTLKRIFVLSSIVMVLASCSSLQTVSDYDRSADFSGYKTYNFYEKGLERLKVNNLDKRRLMAAVEQNMNSKGFVKADKPDILVNIIVVSKERTEVYPSYPAFYGGWGWGMGWRSPYWGGSNYVDRYSEGIIDIDFLDPAKKILVWHGRGYGFNLDDYRKREERLQKGVMEILSQYSLSAVGAK